MAVYNWGPGATPQEQQMAASAQNRYNQPYMGFGSSFGKQPNVYNWQMTPSEPTGSSSPNFALAQMHRDSPYFEQGIPFDVWKQSYLAGQQQKMDQQMGGYSYPTTTEIAAQQRQADYRNRAAQARPSAQPAPTQASQPLNFDFPTAAPSPVPSAPQLDLSGFQLPQTPQFGGIGTNYGAGFGPQQITTGIQSGLLPQSAIDQAVSTAKKPLNAPAMANVSPAQQSALGTLFQDSTRATGMQNAVDLSRSGAYQQAQMGMANQKAQAGAGLDWANLGTRFQETGQQAQQPYLSFLWNMLGAMA